MKFVIDPFAAAATKVAGHNEGSFMFVTRPLIIIIIVAQVASRPRPAARSGRKQDFATCNVMSARSFWPLSTAEEPARPSFCIHSTKENSRVTLELH